MIRMLFWYFILLCAIGVAIFFLYGCLAVAGAVFS